MRNDRHLAEALRRKDHSYNVIARKLGMAKSTLSAWFGDRPWSKKVWERLDRTNRDVSHKRARALAESQGAKWEVWREGYRTEARDKFDQLATNPLFIAGLMLYWGEGDSKSPHLVRLTNTDPRMVRLFVRFLIECCKVPREWITASLILYPDLRGERELDFWSRHVEIPLTQFRKSSVIQSRNFRGLHPSKRLEHGICLVTVCSRGLKEQMWVWQTLCYQRLLGLHLRV